MRLIRTALRLISLLVPAAARPRWREEWLAEINHARSHARGLRNRIRMAAGAIPDALATRRVATAAGRTQGPRANVFHAMDQDVRYAMRGLARSPGFSLGVVLSLGVGIGANAAAFSVIDAAMFRPFPGVRDQHELVRISVGPVSPQLFAGPGLTHRDLLTMREALTTLRGLSVAGSVTFAIFAEGQAAAVPGAVVSGNYFQVLGVNPVAGRFFVEEKDGNGGHAVTVISDALWERIYKRAPSAIGGQLLVNGAALHVIGVAPPRFMGVRKNRQPDLWVPMSMAELALRDRDERPTRFENARGLWFDHVGRRRDGVAIEEVSAQAALLHLRLDATTADSKSRVMASRVWLNDPAANVPTIVGTMALPMLVLAIACVNAANLVLARSSRRVRDWMVRLALGATRWRVVRHVLAESLILSLVAAVLGLLLARWALSLIARQIPISMPLDHRVTLFTIAIAVLTAVAFSLGPALGVTSRATRRLSSASSGQAGSGRSRARFALVALQAALSLGLLATGAQFTKTVQASATQEYIPDPERLLLTSFDLDPLRLEREAGDDFYRRLLDRANAIPGVAAAGIATRGLVFGTSQGDSLARVWLPDSPPQGVGVRAFHVTTGLLDAIAVPLFQGRRFTPADETALRTVVVNKPFVAKFLHGRALGQTFRFARVAAGGGTEVTVVGVVDGMLRRGDQEPPIVYYPAPLDYRPARALFIRLDRTRSFTAAALHAAAREVDARVPMATVSTLADFRAGTNSEVKLLTRAAGLLGLLALLLAAGGLYSVVSYIVSLRRQEVGIRIALGAEARSIVGMIVGQALIPTLVGAAVGAGCAAAAGALIRSRLYGASPVDPVAFGAATLLMLMVMLVASWIPARHAGRVDPISVLRQE
jgi:putative ABC transport system permease protein